jgi:Flp pilus assembly protein TadG
LICGAFALDIGLMVSVKRELTKAAQAVALAGARGLWPQALWQTSGTLAVNRDQAQTWALNAATGNKADGANLTPSEVTVEIGQWNYTTKQFTPDNSINVNGARVTTRKADVRMFLAQIFGLSSKDMSATATAIMDFVGAVGQGTLPIVLNQKYVADPNKPRPTLTIYAGVATNDNGGWFTVPPDSAAASTLKDYIDNPNHLCPGLEIGEPINVQNGQDTTFLKALEDLWNAQIPDPDTGIKSLDCILPVVNTDSFNQTEDITGFVPFRIQEIKDTGNHKMVRGLVLLDGEAQTGLPGGAKFGALAPPKLVY